MSIGRRIEKHPDGSSTIYAGENVEPVHITARRPDGTATVTAKGMQYTLSPDEVEQLINKWKPRPIHEQDAADSGEYGVVSLGLMDRVYDTVKEVMQTATEREKVLDTFTMMCQLFKNNRWVGRTDAGQELMETILEYPKILSEEELPTSMAGVSSDEIRRAFIEAGEIKLPFPRITVIKGSRVETTHGSRLTATTQYPGVNTLMCYFLIQEEDSVKLEYVMANQALGSKPTRAKLHVGSLLLYVERGDIRVGHMMNDPSLDVAKQVSDSEIQDVITLIYMMTHSGGDFMVSKPTPQDIVTNAKRVRKGKRPLIEFKLITIDGKKKDALPSIPVGSHASPRQHWRRGHYRHYKSGKVVFIDPMLVGDEKNGKIIKDYAVGAYEDRGHERGYTYPARTDGNTPTRV